MLANLTFIGGTCLRTCYGGVRLSEDLDFSGGTDFSRSSLASMGAALVSSLQGKYGLSVGVSEPVRDLGVGNVDTWKVKIETRGDQRHLPAQRINIDICAVPSYEKQPMMLLNPYGVDMGTSGLIILAQSREEIYADKLVACALRPNRLKYRDLWDIIWLHGKGVQPKLELIPNKLRDRHCATDKFLELFGERLQLLKTDERLEAEFRKEMQRFLPPNVIKEALSQENLWSFITYLMSDLGAQLRKRLDSRS